MLSHACLCCSISWYRSCGDRIQCLDGVHHSTVQLSLSNKGVTQTQRSGALECSQQPTFQTLHYLYLCDHMARSWCLNWQYCAPASSRMSREGKEGIRSKHCVHGRVPVRCGLVRVQRAGEHMDGGDTHPLQLLKRLTTGRLTNLLRLAFCFVGDHLRFFAQFGNVGRQQCACSPCCDVASDNVRSVLSASLS